MTHDQVRHIFEKVESEGIGNIDTIKQEIVEDKLSKDNIDEDEIITSQMEQWSILSNVINYVQCDRNPKKVYDLVIKTIDQKNHSKIYDRLKDKDRQILE